MKAYGRNKKIRGSGPWKVDYHLHPKRLIENWWESMCGILSRSAQKQNWKKDIEREINGD